MSYVDLLKDMELDDAAYHSRKAREELDDLRKASDRYEVLRKLNPRQFAELYQRNIKGESFDRLVDELVEAR